MADETEPKAPKKRGFATLPPERLKEIARKGGAGTAPDKRAFSLNRELAARAGRQGGAKKPGKPN